MADIELVVKIDKEEYMLIKQKMQLDCGGVPSEAERIIANGTPLPKGHGRLIILSEDAVKRERVPMDCSCQLWISDIGLLNAMVAVIEADKAESEDEE